MSFPLQPRPRRQPISWKELFNKEGVNSSMLNKRDRCETRVKSHREAYSRSAALYNKKGAKTPGFNSWLCPFCCYKGETAKTRDIILKGCSPWKYSTKGWQASAFDSDLSWVLNALTYFHFSKWYLLL